jgi:predicted aspartyl protease
VPASGCTRGAGAGARVATAAAPARRDRRSQGSQRFWEAVANLDLAATEHRELSADERGFVSALRLTLGGDTPGARGVLERLYRTAEDSLVRAASRVTLAGVLQYESDWATLAALPRDSLPDLGVSGADRAAVETWADAFRELPPEQYSFRAEVASVPLALTSFGTPVVAVSLNGRSKLFWLDTGSSLSIVASDVAEECGVVALPDSVLEMVTPTGRVRARPAMIDELAVGPLELRNHPAMIVDAADLQLRRATGDGRVEVVKVDGIVGFHAIRRMDLELDYPNGSVTIRRPAEGARPAEPNLYWLGYPVVRLLGGDGKPLNFALDTGADATFVTSTLLTKVPSQRLTTERRRIAGFGGERRHVVPVLPDLPLVVGVRWLHFRNIIVTEPRKLTFLNLDGVLGSDIARSGKIRIDMTNGIFSLEPTR